MEKGLFHVYTGEGKGKTTAAAGLALRALGRGFKVVFLQFFKNLPSGEIAAFDKYLKDIQYERFNSQEKLSFLMEPRELEILKKETRQGFARAREISRDNLCDLLIMDEFIYALAYQFITYEELKDFITTRPSTMELVITGREAPEEVIELADLVTEMRKIKHYFDRGIPARDGIER